MNNFDYSITILKNVIIDDMPFAIATKTLFNKQELSSESRALISGLVGCELRHHLLFRHLLKEKYHYPQEEEEKYFPLFLVLANVLFYKKFDNDQIIQNTNKMLNLVPQETMAFINEVLNKDALIDKNDPNLLSYRYNIPSWLIKMWTKQFGNNITYLTLKHLYKSSPVIVSINSRVTNEEKLLATGEFEKSVYDNALLYKGQEMLRRTKYAKYHQIFLNKLPYIDILNKIEFHNFMNIAIFMGYSNPLFLDIALNKDEFINKIDLICSDIRDYVNVQSDIKTYQLDKLTLYDAKASTIVTCISEKVDLFILQARNTNYELLKSSPDYFLRCKNIVLDKLINEQRYSLEEAYACLADNATLIYMVPTLNKKETTLLVRDFLLLHSDMSLIEQHLYLPFKESESLMFYAKFIKTKKQ